MGPGFRRDDRGDCGATLQSLREKRLAMGMTVELQTTEQIEPRTQVASPARLRRY
jgi:hypothetical protein